MSLNKVKEAQKVTLIGFVANLILSIGKIIAGFVGQSAAMLADGIHSLSDFITDAIVIIFIRISGKESDLDHAYGHGKYETFATLLISLALFIVSGSLLWTASNEILNVLNGGIIDEPRLIALWAAIISIVVKELLFRYTIKVGRMIDSQVIIANGWHHRSDAFSSIATTLGISGAIFLGAKWRVLDPIAGLIVSLLIVKVAYDLAKPSIEELLEKSLPKEVCDNIVEVIMQNKNVRGYHKLKTRKVGDHIAMDVHILLDRNLTFVDSHNVTKEIENSLKEKLGKNLHISIHAEPYLEVK